GIAVSAAGFGTFPSPAHVRVAGSRLPVRSRFTARLTRQSTGEASLLYFLAELNEFSNLGKGPGTMKVPYAKKWQKETDKLRQIALDCDLTEELKWGKPCFTFLKKNVAIVIPLKESCAFSFFKGALLKDPKHVLERIGEHTQAGRWIKFTSLREIAAVRST